MRERHSHVLTDGAKVEQVKTLAIGYGSWEVRIPSLDDAITYVGKSDYPVGAMLDMLRDIRENLWLSNAAFELPKV